jgi:hypothetical protein
MQPEDLVLVAVMNRRADLEIARTQGWYRIPVRSAPRNIYAQYLAFYQTAKFGSEGRAIFYYAALRGHELRLRRELLPHEAEHLRANEPYYQVQIGPLIRLEQPIRGGTWKRFTFLLTTGERFETAAELKDLVVDAPERAILWHALRESGLPVRRETVLREGRPLYPLDFVIPCRQGQVGILVGADAPLPERPGWKLMNFQPTQVSSRLAACVALVWAVVDGLGGPEDDKGTR